MGAPQWWVNLDHVHSSYAVLVALAMLGAAAGLLYWTGLLGAFFRVFGRFVRGCVRLGFFAWEKLLAWASWPVFLAISVALLVLGWAVVQSVPGLTLLCAAVPLFMGVTACLAYMFIDLERYEVERGYKALHNPVKGQELATHLVRYGPRVRVPLLAAATVGVIGGFALLNQGLYETVGKSWFAIQDGKDDPAFADFLAYPLLHLLRIVDVLNLAESKHFLHTDFVRAARWPASTILIVFKSFFTLILLQQIFASVRQGRLLAETIADFWSPHTPIHERARSALPQFGTAAISPLLTSLRSVESLTREQRDQLPVILATIGPATVPTLIEHLADPHEHVRAVAAGALGLLHAAESLPALAPLAGDASELVRQAAVEAVGGIAAAGAQPSRRRRRRLAACLRRPRRRLRWLPAWTWTRPAAPVRVVNPVGLSVGVLRDALADRAAAVRTQAARALGRVGQPAAREAPALVGLLADADETVRCEAAEALGCLGCADEAVVGALVNTLADASAAVKAAAARALGLLRQDAAAAVPALVPLLQDRDEAVRGAAAASVGKIGQLPDEAAETLLHGLSHPDNVVRAQTAEALGAIGAPAEEAAPALVEALADTNDVVRARAVEALGKIGESAAEVAVPSLMRALRDPDNWVSALAAEALGQMGEAADEAVPALVRSLGHLNPQVRANAAAALGKMGPAAAGARTALEKACGDEDGAVRAEALRAVAAVGASTVTSEQVALAGLRDADPVVRAAAVESLGRRGTAGAEARAEVLRLLEDANDQVKVQAARVLPALTGPEPAVIDALCRRLREDDSAWVQMHAAGALGDLGPAAAAAGAALLWAAQTGAEEVRDQAMRAIARVQPPETAQAFLIGLRDASADIRKVASGGWIKAAIPEEVVPALVETLRDPETQVRANAAHALARLESVPAEAADLLAACAADPSDSLRLHAAMALQRAPVAAAAPTLALLLEDTNVRVRLVAAGGLLAAEPTEARAVAVLTEAVDDAAPRVRRAALELIEALGERGLDFLPALKKRDTVEEDPEIRQILARLTERLLAAAPA
jgi:HEAT repeat protein